MQAEIEGAITQFTKKWIRLKTKLENAILSLPDNPKIRRLDDRCFVLSFSDLGNNWTPFFHDFKQQYKKLVAIIDHAEPTTITPTLRAIIETGIYYHHGHTYRFNPAVIGHLQTLFGGKS